MNIYVGAPLLYALNILEPYPWREHVELVLRYTWGRSLHEMKLAVENMHSVASRVERLRSVALYEVSRRRLQIILPGKMTTFSAVANKSEWFGIPYNLLLPTDLRDHLLLTRYDEDPDLDRYELRFVGSGTNSIEVVASDSFPVVQNWVVALHELATDIHDANRIILHAAKELKRTYPDVLRSIYPSATRIFSGLNYSKRPPISGSTLRCVVHPDDQQMIRTVLDQSAGGMKLPHDQRTLEDLRLYHEEE